MLDHDRIAALMELDHDGQGSRLLTRLAAAFLAGRRPTSPACARPWRGATRPRWATSPITSKGSGGVVGLCEDLELLAGADALGSAGDLLGRLEAELDRVRDVNPDQA